MDVLFLIATTKTQSIGHDTPLLHRRARIGKQPRHTRQVKFLTLEGTFNFQIKFHRPCTCKGELSTISFT